MNSVFISGIPAAGKSYLASKLSEELGIRHIDTDDWRYEMDGDPELKKWVMYYLDKDEKEYWDNTSCENHWIGLKRQSEAFWKFFEPKIREILDSGEAVIFEGVNLLPHLVNQIEGFRGIYLLSEDLEEISKRNKKDPRWGSTEELQRKEAEAFVYCETPNYKREAEKYGYKTYMNSADAEEVVRMIIQGRF